MENPQDASEVPPCRGGNLKEIVKKRFKLVKRTAAEQQLYIQQLPPTPDALRAQHPTNHDAVLPSGCFTRCPLPEAAVMAVNSNFACRSTPMSLQLAVAPPSDGPLM